MLLLNIYCSQLNLVYKVEANWATRNSTFESAKKSHTQNFGENGRFFPDTLGDALLPMAFSAFSYSNYKFQIV